MTAAEVKHAIAKRFALPEWATFFEVANGTGSNASRYADAVAMNLFPSRGLTIHGFEIKISRSDWLRELKNPRKSEDIQKYCDFWWVVAPAGVVLPGELPSTWGHYELKGGKFYVAEKAPKLEAAVITRAFAAAMMRRCGELDNERRRAALGDEADRLRDMYEQRVKRDIEKATQRHKELIEAVSRFEQASGISVRSSWSAPNLGALVKVLLGNYSSLPGRLDQLKKTLSDMLQQAESAAAVLHDMAGVE